MIFCLQIGKLRAQLETYPGLIDLYQRKDPAFPDRAVKWLEEAEKLMAMLQLPDSSELSSLRARILKAEDDFPAVGEPPSRAAVRRTRNAAAADALGRAESILRGRLVAAEDRLRMFEDKLCEGMTAFLLQNTLAPVNGGRQGWLLQVWSQFAQFGATRPLSIYLASSLSQLDRCHIMDGVLTRVATLDAPHPVQA
jgi:hypothetical protein